MPFNEPYSSCTISNFPCRCFEKLTEDEKNQLEEHSVLVKYLKGEIIIKQGSFSTNVMFIEKGLIKQYIEDGNNTLVLKIIPEGNLLGLSSLNEINNTYQYSAMAYVDSQIKQVEMAFFRKLLNENPAFAKEVVDILGSNSLQIYGRFFCLTHKQSYGRLADILLCLSERVFKTPEFELPLTRKDLADLSGMSAETVTRMLTKFNEEGLITMKGKKLKLLDHEKLKRISETG